MNIIEQMLSKYEIESEDALINALKEVYYINSIHLAPMGDNIFKLFMAIMIFSTYWCQISIKAIK